MNNQLVEGKYSFTDLVSIPQLEKLFNQFSNATGFALGLVSHPGQELIINTGWQDICTKFHRAFPKSELHCINSNHNLTTNLKKQKAININHCQSGMVDGATPIIIKGVHIANIFTGQVLFEEPNINYFTKQGIENGYDIDSYIEALKKVSVITEEKFKKSLEFISEMATMIAEQGLTKLESKKAEDDLKKSNVKYQQTVDLLPQMVYESDLEGNLTFVNKKTLDTLGYSPAEFKAGINNFESLIPEDRERAKQNFQKRFSGENIDDFEYTIIRKDGSTLPVLIYADAIIDNNKLVGTRGIMIDITEQKQAKEEALITKIKIEESEKWFRAISEQSTEGITVANADGNYVFSNPAFSKMTGYSSQELLNMKVFDLLENPKGVIIDQKLFGIPTEFVLMRKNGTLFPIEIIVNALKIGSDNLFMGTVKDITERKHAEKELEESEKKFRELFEKSKDAVLILKNGKFVECNKATVDLLKYNNKNEILNLHPSELSPSLQPDGKNSVKEADKLMSIALKNGGHRFEWNHTKSNGVIFPVEVLLTAISNKPNNKVIHVVLRDITERKIAEDKLNNLNEELESQNEEYQVLNEELTKSMNKVQTINNELEKAKKHAEESDRLKSAFLANMSHEIRTPMNGILGFADLLKTPDLSGEELTKYTGIIENSGKRMLNIINDLIDISKIEAGQMEINITECEINKQIEYLHIFFKPEAEKKGLNINISNNIYSNTIIINTDREKLYAILTNLIKNSIKYTHQGNIDIGYKLKQYGNNNYLEFYVEDTGIGIPKDRHEAIFERFVQADIEDQQVYEGAGLGLAITKAYVEMLGGKIWVESTEDVGSKFYFTIPNNSKITNGVNLKNKSNQVNTNNMKTNKLNILIAEDEEFADTYLTIVLEGLSIEMHHAKNGAEAVEIFRNNTDIDLILMDIRMPIMSGYTATEEIRKLSSSVKIIAQTAYALEGDREKAINSGCDDYISKPIDKNKLLDIIANFKF